MPVNTDELSYYAEPGPLTRLVQRPQLVGLPADPAGVARVVQGLMVHSHFAALYGIEVLPKRSRAERELRSAEQLVQAILHLDPSSLMDPRPPERRLIGYCRHFSVLTCALLRFAGVPARSRAGFCMNFQAGRGVDHWILERWDEDRGAWIRMDPQMDDVQCRAQGVAFDPLDLPPGVFLSGSEAWQRCRLGLADPDTFGIAEWWGGWFVRGNVVCDLAALNKVEMLPWDTWGMMGDRSDIGKGRADDLLDEIAFLTAANEWAAFREHYETDSRLRVPAAEVVRFVSRGASRLG